MRIPPDATIARAKLVDYLLVHKRKNDKSKYLAQAGFERGNPAALEAAIRWQVAGSEVELDRVDEFGIYYRATGALHGPDGILDVVTIWKLDSDTGEFSFVTLKPARR